MLIKKHVENKHCKKVHVDNTSWKTIAGHLVFFKSLTLISQVRKIQKRRNQKFPY